MPNLSMMVEPLSCLTCRDMQRKWGIEQQATFQRYKTIFGKNTILVQYNLYLETGISCNASHIEIGTSLFYRNPDRSERPITNKSKTLSLTQCR